MADGCVTLPFFFGQQGKGEDVLSPLRIVREQKMVKFTQEIVSQLTGLNQTRVSQIERGIVTPKPEERRVLAQVLGVSEEEIFPEAGRA
jgi:transcriptional regulator with XRE-family HTH domain